MKYLICVLSLLIISCMGFAQYQAPPVIHNYENGLVKASLNNNPLVVFIGVEPKFPSSYVTYAKALYLDKYPAQCIIVCSVKNGKMDKNRVLNRTASNDDILAAIREILARPNPVLPIVPTFNKNSHDPKANTVWREIHPRDGQQWYKDDRPHLGVFWRYLRPNENPETLAVPQPYMQVAPRPYMQVPSFAPSFRGGGGGSC